MQNVAIKKLVQRTAANELSYKMKKEMLWFIENVLCDLCKVKHV